MLGGSARASGAPEAWEGDRDGDISLMSPTPQPPWMMGSAKAGYEGCSARTHGSRTVGSWRAWEARASPCLLEVRQASLYYSPRVTF